ncbi:glycosyltransferase family 4 protein [Pseudobowmanella zhangzhouensis]|uniref:glycosyltransferase family 4 protein n=1 Tax=Pseudobowmanella zhangzhouensis TaxID=1537679 RepID=UPI00361BF2C0
MVARLQREGVPVRYANEHPGGLWQLLKTHRPAVLHTHGYKAGILGRLFSKTLGIPVVSSYHSGEPGQGRVAWYRRLDHCTAWLAPAIAVSDAIAADVWQRATVVANFVSMPTYMRVTKSPNTVAFVGRFSQEKGITTFCELAAQHPTLYFSAYGDGPLLNDLREQYRGQLAFHGAVDDMTPVWPKIGVLCIPSLHEGLPMVALEALSRGIPVIANDVGDLRRCVIPGETGWLCDPAQPEQLKTALLAWQAMPVNERFAMAQRCRQLIQQQFSCAAQLPVFLDMYTRAVG